MNTKIISNLPALVLRRGLRSSVCCKLPRGNQNRLDVYQQEKETLKENTEAQGKLLVKEKLEVSKPHSLTSAATKWRENTSTPMLEEIKLYRGVDNILNFVVPQIRALSDDELVMAISQISNSQLQERLPPSAFKSDPRFIALLDIVRRKARGFISTDQQISALKMMSLCHVPLNSRVAEVVLNCMKERINDLEMDRAVYLRRLLYKSIESTKLSRALLQAVQLLIKEQLQDARMQSDNPVVLLEVLSFLQEEKNRSVESQDAVMKKLLGKVTQLEPRKVARLAFYLCNLSSRLQDRPSTPGLYSPTVDPLLEVLYYETVKTMMHNLRNFEPKELINVMFAMANNLKAAEFIYSEEFCKAVSSRAIRESWEVKDLHRLCVALSIMQHVDPSLSKHYCTHLEEKFPYFVSGRDTFVNSLGYLSMCNYRPKDFDMTFKRLIDEGETVINKCSNIELLHFSLDAAILGHLVPKILERVLSPQTFEQIEKHGKPSLKQLLLLLDQTVHTFAPELNLPRMPSYMLKQCMEALETRHLDGTRGDISKFKEALEHAFGGTEYVIHGAVTEEGHLIDYVLLLRNNDLKAVRINRPQEGKLIEGSSLTRLEDIPVPSGCTRYHIVVNRQARFVRNVRRLSGFNILRQNMLSRLDGVLIPISKPDWMELPDYEKVPYLLDKVRNEKVFRSEYSFNVPKVK